MIIFPNRNLAKFGEKLLTIIHERTLAGLDKNGKPFAPYSKRVFAMPAAAIPKRARQTLKKNLIWFRKGKTRWVLINGYLTLKKAIYKKTDYNGGVNLTMTGAMLNSMTVIKVGVNELTLGFANTEQAEKAKYNIARGRDFWGLRPPEVPQSAITALHKDAMKR